jgi:hypothetical protein
MKKIHLFTPKQAWRKILLTGIGLGLNLGVWAAPPNHGEPDDKRKTKCGTEKTLNNSMAVVMSKKSNTTTQNLKLKTNQKKKQTSAILLPMVLPAQNLHY